MSKPMSVRSRAGRVAAVGTGFLLTLTGLAVVGAAAPAVADINPDPGTPATVTADALPTTQVNGVVWSQATVGDIVYAGGKFTAARPPGAAAGTNETPRNNLMAYNIRTGQLVTSFAPNLNGQVRAVAASPDGSRLYVGGDFTQAEGQVRSRIAAYDTATGQLVSSFRPLAQTTVRTISATNSTVYFGGDFKTVSSVPRAYVAAVSAANGAVLDWDASTDAPVLASTLTADRTSLVIGGKFGTVKGVDSPGMASLDPTTGAMKRWDIRDTVQNWGTGGSITGLAADGEGVYGTGYAYYGTNGRKWIEGGFRADPDTGAIRWLNDCHGDSYSVFPTKNVVYTASHAHHCGNIGGFPQTDPWTYEFGNAFSKEATGRLTEDPHGYPSFTGQPSPSMLTWYPNFQPGTFTGQGQAGWSVTGTADGDFIAYGGEFPRVNGTAQQGLVRFAVKAKAPVKVGPRYDAGLIPSVFTGKAGEAKVSFKTTEDYDDETLTYKVYRNFRSLSDTPIYETTVKTPFWKPKRLGFIDKTVEPGKRYNYRVYVYDPNGNSTTAAATVVDIPATTENSPYVSAVLADGPERFYRLDEASGTMVFDWAGFNDATANSTVTRGSAGATGDADTASGFNGENSLVVDPTPIQGPNTFTVDGWFKTTSTSGGKIVGFGNAMTGNSGSYDRHVYMTPDGRVVFGAYPNDLRTVGTSTTYNDGQWHYFAASLGSEGMKLSMDGKQVASRTDTTSGQDYTGYWRIGGDSPWEGNAYFAGDIDDVATYPTQLTKQQINNHWVASGRASALPSAPADAYGKVVFNDSPELYWRLDEASGDRAADVTGNANDGRYYQSVVRSESGITADNPSVGLTGGAANVVSTKRVSNPTVFSQEVWINTTTRTGGRIFGFGDNGSDGYSGNYDRHLYMLNDGRVVFGVWTGQTNTMVSPSSLNDGKWHHVVSQISSQGMQMYVDGKLVDTNPNTGSQGYDGYWKLGGDNAWGGYDTSQWNGKVDEAAIYGAPLSLSQVQTHFEAGGGSLPNVAPDAQFSYAASDLEVGFDSSGSVDPDGSIASRSWDFGDGGTSTEEKPVHTFARAGDYQVTLTLKDNKGATGSVTHTVSVVAPNQAPSAGFTSQASDLDAAFTSTATDPDGTIANYEWAFGDGGTSTEPNPRHTYLQSGTYQVSLKVTDNRGGTNTITKPVTVRAANVAPTASFTSSNDGLSASFDGSGSTDPDGTIQQYAWDFGDGKTGSGVKPDHDFSAAGDYVVKLTVTDDRGGSATTQKTVTVAPRPNSAPTASFTSTRDGLASSFDATSSSDTDGSVASYAWDFGDGKSGTGAKPSHTYAAAGTYVVKLTVTDDKGATGSTQETITVSPRPNAAPTASFTSTSSGLTASFDGSGSADSDGTIASYSWEFGDGSTGTGRTASRAYSQAGTYTVRLTVTDDRGSATSTTRSVTVAAPPSTTTLAEDNFARTSSSGWGTADTGGAWTLTGAASQYSVDQGTGAIRITRAGSGPAAYLNGVSATDLDTTTRFSLTNPAGASTFVAVNGRGGAQNNYRAKVQVAPSGAVSLSVTKTVAGTETTVATRSLGSALQYANGDTLNIRVQVFGTSPTTVRAKLWKAGATEPSDWTVSATDATAALQQAGGVGLWTYLGAASSAVPTTVTFGPVKVVRAQ